MSELEKWVILVNSADRPGVMTSVASVFSGRGLQVEAIMGYGGGSGEARLTVIFEALESRKDIMLKLTERLENVCSAEAFSYYAPELIKTVTVKVKGRSTLPDQFMQISPENIYTYTGSCSEVDHLLKEISEELLEQTWHLTKRNG